MSVVTKPKHPPIDPMPLAAQPPAVGEPSLESLGTRRSTVDGAHVTAKDDAHVMRPWPCAPGDTIIVDHALDCIVTDVFGKSYIDFTSGYFVNNAGHCHPNIVAAVTEQMTKVFQTSGKFGSVAAVRLAERLMSLVPSNLGKVFFSTGGSEANEFALKIARQATGKPTIAYLENGYHGLTLGALEVTANDKYRATAGKPIVQHAYGLPIPYPYRAGLAGAQGGMTEAESLAAIEKLLRSRPDTAAIIAEPIQAVGGMAPSKAWWAGIERLRRELGVLLILDEVQTGMGRTGKMFALEHYGLIPDIITAGKGISGGVGSLGATFATDALVSTFFGGTTPTSGGNAISAAAGLALIDTIIEHGMIENAAAMGRYFTEKAYGLDDPWIGDVRFTGLLGGIELVADRTSKAVLGKAAVALVKDLLQERGMLITVSGMYGNYLRLQPPLSVTTAHLDRFIAALAESLREARKRLESA